MQNYRELRCKYCGRLLAKGSGYVQIKCARCKNINSFSN
ncbi:TPA: Com family DNA-binding transcriptional regulator [Neisseria meningitidis]|nr:MULTISPECIES: Com family DNA-binding transcriptional regulator [Neisseria]CWO40202.1 Mu-like prophage protein Com [Neisseria meningitidis]CWS28795.1 Mu-like prophage protein Com [Neisseria meningitidis]SUA15061.1 Mu-like prophage protein Com [Neisseria lactamica]